MTNKPTPASQPPAPECKFCGTTDRMSMPCSGPDGVGHMFEQPFPARPAGYITHDTFKKLAFAEVGEILPPEAGAEAGKIALYWREQPSPARSDMLEAERKLFDAWAAKFSWPRDDNGLQQTGDAWDAWQARATLAASTTPAGQAQERPIALNYAEAAQWARDHGLNVPPEWEGKAERDPSGEEIKPWQDRDSIALHDSFIASVCMQAEIADLRAALARSATAHNADEDKELNARPCPKCGKPIGKHTQVDWERCFNVKTPDEDDAGMDGATAGNAAPTEAPPAGDGKSADFWRYEHIANGLRHRAEKAEAELAAAREELAAAGAARQSGVTCNSGSPDLATSAAAPGDLPPQRIAELERAADYLEQYAKYCYEVKPEDIERHPYIPSIEEAAENLRAMIAEGGGRACIASNAGAAPGVHPLYTCKGKGGEYAFIGVVYGAGSSRGVIVNLYRETATGVMYYRTPTDFAERMEKLAPSTSPVGAERRET